MKRRILQRATKILAWGIVVGVGAFFLRAWLAPDACLDFGGSFNYERWECTGDVNDFVDVRFYELKSFWLFGAALVGACVLQWVWRAQSNKPLQSMARDDARTG
jgi:hypothetical protein